MHMKKLRSENGFTGVDIAISVVLIFIFVSIIALLIYRFNSSANSLQLQSIATYIAVDEIEKLKAKDFSYFEELNKDSVSDKEGNSLVNQKIEEQEGFYKTIIIEDYTDFNEEGVPDLVKKVTVRISYKFKAKEEKVELSTLITKER